MNASALRSASSHRRPVVVVAAAGVRARSGASARRRSARPSLPPRRRRSRARSTVAGLEEPVSRRCCGYSGLGDRVRESDLDRRARHRRCRRASPRPSRAVPMVPSARARMLVQIELVRPARAPRVRPGSHRRSHRPSSAYARGWLSTSASRRRRSGARERAPSSLDLLSWSASRLPRCHQSCRTGGVRLRGALAVVLPRASSRAASSSISSARSSARVDGGLVPRRKRSSGRSASSGGESSRALP